MSKIFSIDSLVGKPESSYSGVRITTFEPIFLNSGEIMFLTLATLTANEIKVGGTSIVIPSLLTNEPLIESFPPIAATSKSN